VPLQFPHLSCRFSLHVLSNSQSNDEFPCAFWHFPVCLLRTDSEKSVSLCFCIYRRGKVKTRMKISVSSSVLVYYCNW
jgi:hypothetical protein